MTDNIEHTKEMIKIKERNLHILETQAANFGTLYVPIHISTQIDDLKREIRELRERIDKIPTSVQPSLLTQDGGKGGKIRILFLSANPKGTVPLKLDEEMHEIDTRLRSSDYRDRFEFIKHTAVRSREISELLLRHKPHIVHFSGHGSPVGEIHLEDDSGNSKAVSAAALTRLFGNVKKNIRCVILNSCWSMVQAKAISQVIDCVAGMAHQIHDTAAIKFASGFYMGIGYGEDIQTAFNLGCGEIDIDGLGEEETPKLLSMDGVNPAEVFLL